MNMNKYLDISGIGKALKNASKSVEKSIDGLIGIPDTDQNNSGSSTDTIPLSSSPSSYFGLSFTQPTQQQQQQPATPPPKPKVVTTPTTTSPVATSPVSTTPQKVKPSASPNPDEKTQQPLTPQDLSPILPRKGAEKINHDDTASFKDNSDNDINTSTTAQSISSKFMMDEQLDVSNVSFGDDLDIDLPDDIDPSKSNTTTIEATETTTTPNTLASDIKNEEVNDDDKDDNDKGHVNDVKEIEESVRRINEPKEESEQVVVSKKDEDKYVGNSREMDELKQKLMENESKLSALMIVNQEKDRILVEREKQCQNLSSHGAKLQKTIDQLLIDVGRLNSDQKKEDIENLKEEFSRRIAQMEKKLLVAQKERDSHKSGAVMSEQLATSIKDKDDQISQLISEGTNLSHKVLQLENTIKKLRSTNKEHEETVQMMTDRLKTTEDLLSTKVDRLKDLEETDRKYHDTLLTMKEVTEMTTKKYEEKGMVAEKASKQVAELQSALEKAWKDISEMTKQHAQDQDRFARQIEEARARMKDDMIASFKEERKEVAKREETLEMVVQEQKASIQRLNERYMWKEEELNKEIQHLNNRCREAEMRNDQLGASIPDTTRPLIKQIEALQSANEARQNTWDAIERSLQQQLKEAKQTAEQAVQSEKEVLEELEEMTLRNGQLESELKKERNAVKTAQSDLVNEKNRWKEMDSKCKELTRLLEREQAEGQQLQKQIANYEEKLEKSYKDYREAEELRQKEREIERERKEDEKRSPLNQSYEHTPSKLYGLRKNSSQLDFMQQSQLGSSTSSLPMEFYHANSNQKDGEIAILQSKLQTTESLKKKLEEELIKLTTSNEQLLIESKELKSTRTEVQEMQKRYGTALEMLGEKEEAVNELKMDIMDMKELYKTQINELLAQIETLKKK